MSLSFSCKTSRTFALWATLLASYILGIHFSALTHSSQEHPFPTTMRNHSRMWRESNGLVDKLLIGWNCSIPSFKRSYFSPWFLFSFQLPTVAAISIRPFWNGTFLGFKLKTGLSLLTWQKVRHSLSSFKSETISCKLTLLIKRNKGCTVIVMKPKD